MTDLPDAAPVAPRLRHPSRAVRRRGGVRRIGLLGLATTGIAVGGLFALLGGTSAGYADKATAVVEAGGSYDIAIEGVAAATNALEVSEGRPTIFLLANVADAKFTKTDPLTWDIAVINRAAPGTVTLYLSDPADRPFTVGSTTYPDLYSKLRFTVTDSGTGQVLASGIQGAALGADTAGLSLGRIETGARRDLTVSVLVDPDTWSVYNGQTTNFRMMFVGTT